MKCLLLVCWCCSILTVTSSIRVDGYSCVSAYWDTVSCVLDITGAQQQSTYSLEFRHLYIEEWVSCPLVLNNSSYSCVCKLTNGSDLFLSTNQYHIKLCQESACHSVTEEFEPSQNIQLTPPHKPEVQQTPEAFNITWKSGYEDHRYLRNTLRYELLLQTSESKHNQTLYPNSLEKSFSIKSSELKPDATYCLKVRSLPDERYFNGHWSEWSPSTCWKTEAGEGFSEQDNILVILTKFLSPVCVAVGILLFVFYSPAARMKIKTLSHTPSPAPFFQPLFKQHDGNLQEWLSPQGKFMQTYKTEEILTTDAVIVVPKPIMKDAEEYQDSRSPSVTQLAFVQCQTSYVGLPGIHTSPALTVVCQGDTSYTQLPCSVWGVGCGQVEVASSPPTDIFNISHADTGCSCEDLTKSPECSLPSSPAVDSPPPSNCHDYCILNKTAEGFAPVLMSKGGSLDAPSHSLQNNKS